MAKDVIEDTSVTVSVSTRVMMDSVGRILTADHPNPGNVDGCCSQGSFDTKIPETCCCEPMCFRTISVIRRSVSTTEFKCVKLCQLLCGMYILIVTFTDVGTLGIFGGAMDPASGFIIDPNSQENTNAGIIQYSHLNKVVSRAIVANSLFQQILLGISRFSAFSMYPATILVFYSKLRATQAVISKTPFSVFCISDTHQLHRYCGMIIFLDSILHTVCHLLRWALQKNLYLVFFHQSGVTGLIVIVSTIFIAVPMTFLKRHLTFEIRKYSHYMFWIFCSAMTFHAPFHALPNGGFCAIIYPLLMTAYALDALYVKCCMSERISTVKYKVLKSGVELTMPVSERFQKNLLSGGYGYIMFDWIDKHQWHVFSLYENPLDQSLRHMFIAKVGDWTEQIHAKVDSANTVRPVWISGPFPSPYNNAINYDNMILVASGIGITPALSAIEAYRESRRINLIWAVRDASTLVFFLENAKLDEKGFNLIFYTGKESLPDVIENYNGQAHVKIVKERPNLAHLIPNIIQYVDKEEKFMNGKSIPKEVNSYNHRGESSSCVSSEDSIEALGIDVELGEGTGPDCWTQIVLPSEQFHVQRREGKDGPTSDGSSSESDIETLASYYQGRNNYNGVMESLANNTGHPPRSIWRTASIRGDGRRRTSMTPRVWKEKSDAKRYVKSMADDDLETWGLLYCGGRSKLLDYLVQESKDLGLPLHQEAFDW
jgi:predicted ferric reductase